MRSPLENPSRRDRVFVALALALATTACSSRSDGPDASAPSDDRRLGAHAIVTPAGDAPPSSGATSAEPGAGPSEPVKVAPGAIIIDHTSVDLFDKIPPKYLSAASSLRVFYGRLSHGDQLLNGLKMIHKAKGPSVADGSSIEAFYSSLDPGRETPEWERATRDRLAKGGLPQVVMWAWSGNVGRPEQGGTDAYIEGTLASLEKLEADYPKIRFVYFTGPMQPWRGAVDYAKHNATIRRYAKEHGKVLYDFEDIEVHSPDGVSHADGTDKCEWCEAWCQSHDCSMLDMGAHCVDWNHTHCLNVYRKGQALWVLLARLAGWDGK